MTDAAGARRTIVLVEGESDRRALAAAARVLRLPLPQDVSVEVLGGITNLRRRLAEADAGTADVRTIGLYDASEGEHVQRVLVDAGRLALGADPATAGFFGCDRDLEDEVIRAAGPDLVLRILDVRGELARFRVFQGQPAQRVRSVEAQLHRFAGTAGGRKTHFAADIVTVLAPAAIPAPLRALITAARTA
ncbi:hypothetical protein GCM10025768_03570 [Microbacterium pseudoresistens]|uniref:ATP-dependent endonuclease n=1 Tax=Microbacterium pseudoresistens TaxID=640634 RepID=A0A7Y9EUH2_9MICO|nr:hypothetical protein [Microbacterium pseudoresistens]NYD54193.1 hypothetical protein [Microbacterium pseudoresistens]